MQICGTKYEVLYDTSTPSTSTGYLVPGNSVYDIVGNVCASARYRMKPSPQVQVLVCIHQ